MWLIVRISRQILHLKSFFYAEIMMNMGYSRKEIEDSLSQNKYDDITATYLLLGRRTMEVSSITIIIIIVIVCHHLALVCRFRCILTRRHTKH